jgi:hypothetical protein
MQFAAWCAGNMVMKISLTFEDSLQLPARNLQCLFIIVFKFYFVQQNLHKIAIAYLV